MKNLKIIVPIAALFASCSSEPETVKNIYGVDIEISELNRTRTEAKQLVRNALRDPESAIFRNVVIHGGTVCGESNSRNGFGGMGGWEPFIAMPQVGTVHFLNQGDDTVAPIMEISCARDGGFNEHNQVVRR